MLSTTVAGSEKREEILLAAIECFSEKGFRATKMLDIAHRVGMSVGNLYNYFRNKDEVVEKLALREIETLVSRIRESEAHRDDKSLHRRILKSFVMARMDEKHARIALELMSEAARNPRIATIVREFDNAWRTQLLSSYVRFGLTEREADERLKMDMCILDGLTLRVMAHPDVDKEKLAEKICDFIMDR